MKEQTCVEGTESTLDSESKVSTDTSQQSNDSYTSTGTVYEEYLKTRKTRRKEKRRKTR